MYSVRTVTIQSIINTLDHMHMHMHMHMHIHIPFHAHSHSHTTILIKDQINDPFCLGQAIGYWLLDKKWVTCRALGFFSTLISLISQLSYLKESKP